jgi:phenylpropionate dioxygenase-like ring-hydroxylating dioxygenase large terminal subunit
MTVPADLFDPRLYEPARRPFLEAESLPPWCYTSETWYAREKERLFLKSWNFLGREDEIPNPGDFLVIDMVGESILLTRDRQGKLHAFANFCRHRGTRLADGKGNCKVLTCPYHGWSFAHSGELVGVPGMEETKGFDRKDWSLVALRLESWAGFLFVNFDRDAEPLAKFLGNLPERFASYRFEDFVCVRRKEYDLACNWKVYLENAMEDYHTPVVHKNSIGLQQTTTEQETRVGNWDAIFMPAKRTIAVLPEEATPFPHVPTLEGRPAQGTFFTALYPSTFFASTQDCMWWLQSLPLAAGRTRISIGSCFPRATVARADFAEIVPRYYKRWDKSLPEDNWISERQQTGLSSAMTRPGRYSSHEPIVHAIANWVLDRVLDRPAGKRGAATPRSGTRATAARKAAKRRPVRGNRKRR